MTPLCTSPYKKLERAVSTIVLVLVLVQLLLIISFGLMVSIVMVPNLSRTHTCNPTTSSIAMIDKTFS